MGKSAVKLVEEFQKRTHRRVNPSGSQPAYEKQNETRILRLGDVKQYFVEYDSLKLASSKEIGRDEYEKIKGSYDICMIMWQGGNLGLGEKIFYISGKRRHLVEAIAIEHAKKFYPRESYLEVHQRNKGEVRTGNICSKAEEEHASILYLRAHAITAIEEGD